MAIAVLGVGYVNTHTDETGIIAGSLFLAAVALGALWPRRAAWALLLLALSVPVSQLVMRVLALRVPYPNSPTDISGAIVPALIAAAIGTAVGWGVGRLVLSTHE